MKESELNKLVERYGQDYVSRRLRIQVNYAANVLGHGTSFIHLENLELGLEMLGWVLRIAGLWRRGYRNMKAQRVVYNDIPVLGLPEPFENFRLLQISDLHLDAVKGFGSHLGRLISDLDFDVALLTGDFRYLTHGDYYPMFREINDLSEFLACRFGCYAILGNHDFLEFVPHLEKNGVKVLINEAVPVELKGSRIWIVGLDDAHFYGLHDYARAFRGIPTKERKVLMIHSPETLDEAANYRPDLILSGHTHGGQICLPGGLPLWLNAKCRGMYCRGRWTFKGIKGYTSVGAGSSGLPVRLNCPPEIVIHRLHSRHSEKGRWVSQNPQSRA